MIPYLRKHTRLGFTLLVALSFFAVRMAAIVLRPIAGGLEQEIRRGLFSTGCRVMLAVSGARVEVRGTAPKAPFFMVSNHLSFFDIFVIASQVGCVFVSRDDVLRWPLFGTIIKHMNTIFIDRHRLKETIRVNAEVTKVMQQGYGVHIFAESRCSQDGQVQPFKPALFETPARLDFPIYYATIHYATPEGCPPASEVAIWKDGVSFFRHYLDLAALPYFNIVLTFGEEPFMGDDRKVLAEELREAVREQFVPID